MDLRTEQSLNNCLPNSQRYVYRVVRRDVFAQLPRTSQKIDMGVTVEIEVCEIRDRFGRAVRRSSSARR